MTTAIFTIAACAVLNRARGDDSWMPDWMPGRALIPVGLLALTFPILAVAAYEAAWRIRPANPIWIAELIVGALWGVLIVCLA